MPVERDVVSLPVLGEIAAGQPIVSGGIALKPVKPDWARFGWPGEATAAE